VTKSGNVDDFMILGAGSELVLVHIACMPCLAFTSYNALHCIAGWIA
jgi:hypothetical protein